MNGGQISAAAFNSLECFFIDCEQFLRSFGFISLTRYYPKRYNWTEADQIENVNAVEITCYEEKAYLDLSLR